MVKVKSRPVMALLRVGTIIDYALRFSEFGTDEHGCFAVVERLSELSDVRKVIEIKTDGIETEPYDVEHYVEPAIQVEEKEHATPEQVKEKANAVVQASSQVMSKKEKADLDKKAKELKAKKTAKPIGPVTVTETLNVQLSDDERDAAAKAASNLLGQLEDAELRKKNFNAGITAEIKTLKEKISRAKSAHNTGLEYKSVNCEQHFAPEKLMTWFVYQGREYGARPMNEREERETRAGSLFGDAPLLPNKVDAEASVVSTGDDLAKKAAEHEERTELENKRITKKAQKEIDDFKAGKKQTRESEIREVMNEEKKKGGKRDHVTI